MLLNYEDHGQGDTVVLLGSIASTTRMWDAQVAALKDTYRVITLDHRGHGKSSLPEVEPGETTMADLAHDVVETLDSLNVGTFAVVGLSLGGAIAQYLATGDRVTKAVFACTATKFGTPEKWESRATFTRAEGLERMATGVMKVWLTPDFRKANPEVADFARDMVASTQGEGYAQCADALGQWDFASSLPQITCPVLTIAGADDTATPPDTVAEIAHGVGGEARSIVLPGGHVPNLESPEKFNEALRYFLSQP